MWSTVSGLLRVPTFVVLTMENVLSGIAMWVFISWLPLFFQETFGLSLALAGLYGTLWFQGGRIAGVALGGFPSDRVARVDSRYRMLIMVITYFLACPLLLAFAFTSNFVILATVIVLFSLLTGMGYVNAQPLLCDFLPERTRSTAVGFMNMTSCLTGGGGVLLAGALKSSFGLSTAFASLAVIQAMVAGMLLIAFLTILPKDLAKIRAQVPADAEARVG